MDLLWVAILFGVFFFLYFKGGDFFTSTRYRMGRQAILHVRNLEAHLHTEFRRALRRGAALPVQLRPTSFNISEKIEPMRDEYDQLVQGYQIHITYEIKVPCPERLGGEIGGSCEKHQMLVAIIFKYWKSPAFKLFHGKRWLPRTDSSLVIIEELRRVIDSLFPEQQLLAYEPPPIVEDDVVKILRPKVAIGGKT